MAESVFGLAGGGQGNAKVFAEERIAEAGDGDVFWDYKSLLEKDFCTACGNNVINGLDSGGVR